MELSPEDQLRLNVLLAHAPEAIRIDEPTLTVHALANGSEARVALNPNCRAEQYLRRVRETLSYHALGSPGGYPVFLQRWTRMGQHREGQLDRLLLLGEPEAVIAVAGAPGLTAELARRVWWLVPESDIARRMLERETIVADPLGRELAMHLVEHLAFETEPLTIIDTVRLVLQPGLIGEESRARLWARATARNGYRAGFLAAQPDSLPDPRPARASLTRALEAIAPLAASGNAQATLLAKLLGIAGQTFLAVSVELLQHPLDKYVAALLLNTVGGYFRAARADAAQGDEALALLRDPQALLAPGVAETDALLVAAPTLRAEIAAMRALSLVGEDLATPILSRTTATGTLLRRKLEPVTAPILAQCGLLQGNTPRA